MTLKSDTEIICLSLPEFFELSNHVSECIQNAPFRGKKSKKISDSPLPRPLPHWEGDTPSQTSPLCSNIVDDKTVTEMM